MRTNYIGLSCSGHDSAIAILNSHGDVVFAEAAERGLQSKRALDAPPDDFHNVVRQVNEFCDPDSSLVVCTTWSAAAGPWFEQLACAARDRLGAASRPREGASPASERLREFLCQNDRDLLRVLDLHKDATVRVGRNLRHAFGARLTGVRRYDHHLTHAALGCFGSGLPHATCVVVDGLGEGPSATVFDYSRGKLRPMRRPPPGSAALPASLGLFYASLCSLVGYDHWRGEEWKVMGLAAYGREDPKLQRLFQRCLTVDDMAFSQSADAQAAWFQLLKVAADAEGSRETVAALARAGQAVFEQRLREFCSQAAHIGSSTNLILTGGCALNSSANGKLLDSETFGFERLHVPFAPADDGNAIGAAQLAFFEDHPDAGPDVQAQKPYLGSRVSLDVLERSRRFCGLPYVKRLDENGLCREVAYRLSCGEIVGWVQGRAEFGPRALGNRSILADPRDPSMKDRINARVKMREPFRPLAPAILLERAPSFFENFQESPYMERTLRWRPQVRTVVPAVVHPDGTGRVQTVDRDSNPRFRRLLEAFECETSVPLLVNTSLNIMGKPMAHSVEDAIAILATSDLDALAVEDVIFAKAWPPDGLRTG